MLPPQPGGPPRRWSRSAGEAHRGCRFLQGARFSRSRRIIVPSGLAQRLDRARERLDDRHRTVHAACAQIRDRVGEPSIHGGHRCSVGRHERRDEAHQLLGLRGQRARLVGAAVEREEALDLEVARPEIRSFIFSRKSVNPRDCRARPTSGSPLPQLDRHGEPVADRHERRQQARVCGEAAVVGAERHRLGIVAALRRPRPPARSRARCRSRAARRAAAG